MWYDIGMISYQDLNPEIKKLIEIATEGFSFFESARFRTHAMQEIEKAALCGIILPSQIITILDNMLCSEIAELKDMLKDA